MEREYDRRGASRIAGRLGPVILIVASSLFALLLSEGAYRIARMSTCLASDDFRFFRAESWGWSHVPNASGWMQGCIGRVFEWKTHVTVNAQGLRDVPRELTRRRGVPRALLLGDSMTEAVQVPLEQTFAQLIERRHARTIGPIEVLNCGHSGYGTDNELLFYRERGHLFDSDVVVLVLNLSNDVLENTSGLYKRAYARANLQFPPKPHFELSPEGELELVPVDAHHGRGGMQISGALYKNFYLLRMIGRLISGSTSGPAPTVPVQYEIYWSPPTQEWFAGWQVTFALVRRMRAEAEAHGSTFGVVVMPAREMVAGISQFGPSPPGAKLGGWDIDSPRRLAVDFLSKEGIPFLDLSPFLQASRDFFSWDIHLTATGHATVAEPILNFLVRLMS